MEIKFQIKKDGDYNLKINFYIEGDITLDNFSF